MDDLQTLATVLAVPDPSRDVADRSRHKLQNAMRGPARRRRTGWLAAGLGLTATAAGIAVVVTSGTTAPIATPNSPPATTRLSGRQILLAAATTAERQPAGTGTYWYVKTAVPLTDPKDVEVLGTRMVVSETWTRRDGQSWSRNGKGSKVIVKDERPSKAPFLLGFTYLTFEQLQKLPTTAAGLKAWFTYSFEHPDNEGPTSDEDTTRDGYTREHLFQLLTYLPAPPKVRAAAFRVLATLPNVTSLGVIKGGQGLLVTTPPHRSSPRGDQGVWVIDPKTSLVRVAGGVKAGEKALSGSYTTFTAEWTNLPPR